MNLLQKPKRRDEPLRLVILISLIITNARSCGAESSGEYLQKVMIELQELNVPSSMAMHDRLSMNLDYHAGYQDDRAQHNSYRKLSTTNKAHQQSRPNAHQNVQKPAANLPVEHVDTAQSGSNNVVQYYAVRDPPATSSVSNAVASYPKVKYQQQQQQQQQHLEQPLAFTRAELAALYKKALEKGPAINLSSLAQVLNAAGGGTVPQIGAHTRLPIKSPMYNYYFFPLKSFVSELQKDHQATAIGPIFAATESLENPENTQKEVVNPLFVAIGTFISMALLFMMGVLFLPKLPQLPNFQVFNARVADDEFQRLTAFVMNAIDRYYILEKFQHG